MTEEEIIISCQECKNKVSIKNGFGQCEECDTKYGPWIPDSQQLMKELIDLLKGHHKALIDNNNLLMEYRDMLKKVIPKT